MPIEYYERFLELKKIVEEAYYNLEDVANDKLLSNNLYEFDERMREKDCLIVIFGVKCQYDR